MLKLRSLAWKPVPKVEVFLEGLRKITKSPVMIAEAPTEV
jgi:hypothetical protein